MKKRSAPTVEDPSLQRVVNDIYIILNELISLASGLETEKSSRGEGGKINIIKSSDGYNLEVKHKDGWLTTSLSKRERKTGN